MFLTRSIISFSTLRKADHVGYPFIDKQNHMRALAFHLPLILVMLSATTWVFIIAAHNPGWFQHPTRKRAFYSAVEGVFCALIWSIISLVVQQLFAVQDPLSPAVAGLGWGAMSFYGKTRFKANVEAVEQGQMFRR
jgi:hypothetical protein